MKDNKNHSKEGRNNKPKKTRSSKQNAGIWVGAAALLVAAGSAVLKALSNDKGNGNNHS